MSKLSRHLSAKISDTELAVLNVYANQRGLSVNGAIRELIQNIERPETDIASLTTLAEQVARLNETVRTEMIEVLTELTGILNRKIGGIESDALVAVTAITKLIQSQHNGTELLKIITIACQAERDRRSLEQQRKKEGSNHA